MRGTGAIRERENSEDSNRTGGKLKYIIFFNSTKYFEYFPLKEDLVFDLITYRRVNNRKTKLKTPVLHDTLCDKAPQNGQNNMESLLL